MKPRIILVAVILFSIIVIMAVTSFAAEYTSVTNNTSIAQVDALYATVEISETVRVSVASNGDQGDAGAWKPTISNDGHYMAFISGDGNLVVTDTNGVDDIFVHDLQTGKTTLVSLTSNNTLGNGHSRYPKISADGNYVVFTSDADNLIEGDDNGVTDVFVRDRVIGQTYGVSMDPGSTQLNGGFNPVISADGHYVAYVKGVSPYLQIYLHDLHSHRTIQRIPADTSGALSISADGQFITFTSQNDDLIPEDNNYETDVFVYDRETETISLVSVSSNGIQGDRGSGGGSISADGRYVSFDSTSNTLTGGEPTSEYDWDVFVKDRQTGDVTRVSMAYDNTPTADGRYSAISPDGRYVTFQSGATNLVISDTNGFSDVFVRDLVTEKTTLVSVATYTDGSQQGNDTSLDAVPSIYGRYIVFRSNASNLVISDTNGVADIFVHDRGVGAGDFSISGQVRDDNGSPLSEITILNNVGLVEISDENGHYNFTGLVTGTYTLTASLPDYDIFPDSWMITVPPNRTEIDFIGRYKDPDLALAERFAPFMYFHQDESYRPITVTIPLAYSQLENITKPYILRTPILTDLMTETWNDNLTFINLRGDGKEGVRNFYSRVVYPEVTQLNANRLAFARVQRDNARGKIAIQYWFYYYANPWKTYHEGDWEMVQVVLDSNENPLYAAYTHHLVHSKRWWSDMETSGDHPIVYVAQGGHANYFKPYDYWQRIGIDETSPHIANGIPQIEMFPGEIDSCQDTIQDTWPCFQGHWGAFPEMIFPGPGHVVKGRWDDPIGWSEGYDDLEWDENGLHNQFIKFHATTSDPHDIHVYEIPTFAHVGWNNGQIDLEIEDAEYFDNPATGMRTIILHNTSSLNPRYQIVLGWRPTLPNARILSINDSNTATINFPDVIAGTSITATYTLSNSWGISTTGVVTASHNSNFEMMVDIDGDGVVDQQIMPVLEETPFDFIPPATITNLAVTATAPGAATLNWTAPGDDENTGTVTAYDIRYATTPIINSNWVSATLIVPPTPALAGAAESITVTNLPGGTLYFAIRSIDDIYRFSTLSNVVEVEIPYGIYLPVVLRPQ